MSQVTFQTQPCMMCKETTMLVVDRDKYDRWVAGEHVQNVWPEKSPDERELFITGTHPACWDRMFSA